MLLYTKSLVICTPYRILGGW